MNLYYVVLYLGTNWLELDPINQFLLCAFSGVMLHCPFGNQVFLVLLWMNERNSCSLLSFEIYELAVTSFMSYLCLDISILLNSNWKSRAILLSLYVDSRKKLLDQIAEPLTQDISRYHQLYTYL